MRMVVLELIILDLTISQPALENLIQYMQSPLLLWRHELMMGLGGVRMGVLFWGLNAVRGVISTPWTTHGADQC
jgi:hypothetical protein